MYYLSVKIYIKCLVILIKCMTKHTIQKGKIHHLCKDYIVCDARLCINNQNIHLYIFYLK